MIMSKTKPLVTIGIPTYNRADDYLRQTLESALNQTYHNLEVIVSDNCSPDNTEAVVRSYTDLRIRYFRQTRGLKPNDNFNFCLKQAKGSYFLLLHDDDVIDKDFVEICMKAANYSTDIGIIRTGIRLIDSSGKELWKEQNPCGGLSTEEFIKAFLARKMCMFLCGSLFNTKRLKEIGGFYSEYLLWQDVHTELQLAARFGRADVPDVKASMRKHFSATTYNVDISEWVEDSIFLLNALCDLSSEKESIIRKQGMQYFAEHNYMIADEIKSPAKRFIAYLIVFKKFKVFKKLKFPSIAVILSHTPLYYPLRFIKRKNDQMFKRI